MTYLILYCTLAIVYECTNAYFGYKTWKVKAKENMQLQVLKGIKDKFLEHSPSARLIKRKLYYYVPAVALSLLVAMCLVFPINLLTKIRRLIYKTKLEKESDEHTKKIEQAKKDADNFLKNEGDMDWDRDDDGFLKSQLVVPVPATEPDKSEEE